VPQFQVAIIGGRPGGITAAYLLRQSGIEDFVILERDTDFGGTWRDNHYPGLGLYEQLMTDAEVTQQTWDDAAALWRLEIAGRSHITARYVISAVGGYVNAKPDIDIDMGRRFHGHHHAAQRMGSRLDVGR
jgi:cation diffusion facilitator CzcD-associated flavoprotein CzcO